MLFLAFDLLHVIKLISLFFFKLFFKSVEIYPLSPPILDPTILTEILSIVSLTLLISCIFEGSNFNPRGIPDLVTIILILLPFLFLS
jgi:hypothetical protein